MNTVITIGGVPYDESARAAARFNEIDRLLLNVDGGADEASFTLSGLDDFPPFGLGDEVLIEMDGDLRFTGDIVSVLPRQTNFGWALSFRSLGLKKRAEYIVVRGLDGSGRAAYNRTPGDQLYVASDAGLTVGEIVTRVLEIEANAAALTAAGIGNYTGTPPTYNLPSATATDLAALDIVPPRPVTLSGEGIIAQIEALIQRWHGKYGLRIEADGTIRIRNLFAMTAYPLVVPGESGAADPIEWPEIEAKDDGCYTRVRAIGTDIQVAILSELDGTLERAWTGTQEGNWTLDDFEMPKDGYDTGTVTSMTTTSVTIQSDYPLHHWAADFWSDNQGHINLTDSIGVGIDVKDGHRVTTCTSMTAGGTATISWDASDPAQHTGFDTYQLVASAGALVEVGRLFYVREPSSGDLGVDTFIGPRLVPALPRPVAWFNNGRLAASTGIIGGQAIAPTASILYSDNGLPPYRTYPIQMEIVPSIGAIRLMQPDVTMTSSRAMLQYGYPTTYAGGKRADITALVAYNRGALEVTAPTSGWEGTASTLPTPIERELVLTLDDWIYAGDTANIAKLCQEHLDVVKDVVLEGAVSHKEIPAGFDPLLPGFAVNLTISGGTLGMPWESADLPVRSILLTWPQGSGVTHRVDMTVSNRRRSFQGDDLYLHPAPTGAESSGQMPFGEGNVIGASIGVFNMQMLTPSMGSMPTPTPTPTPDMGQMASPPSQAKARPASADTSFMNDPGNLSEQIDQLERAFDGPK